MWSLSLEEQFYLLWAPTLFFVHRFTSGVRHAAVVLFLLFSASLAMATTLYPSVPSVVFFELPARIFQFAAGALVALWEASRHPINNVSHQAWEQSEENALPYKPLPTDDDHDQSKSSVISGTDGELSADDLEVEQFGWQSKFVPLGKELLGFFCIGVLCLSYILLPKNASPLHMLPTTLSTCLTIMLPGTFLSRHVLSNGLLRFVGRISYSAYLVHWPLWVFTVHTMRALHMGLPNPVAMIVATAFGATLLQKSVENPFRQGQRKIMLAVISGVTGCVALLGVATDGFAFRFGNIDFDLSNLHQAGMLMDMCRDESGRQSERLPPFHVKTCRVGDLNGTRSNYAFFGDSFTLHLTGALDGVGKRRKEWYSLHFQSGCTFLPHSARSSIKRTRFKCQTRHDELWRELRGLENGSIVAVGNSWSQQKKAEVYFPSFVKDIKAAGYRTAIVAEPPGLASDQQGYFDCADFAVLPISRLWQLVRKGAFHGAKECGKLDEGLPPVTSRPREAIAYRKMAKQLGLVKVIEIFDKLCSQSKGIWRCRVPVLDKIAYDIGYRRDRRHLTKHGSEALSKTYELAMFGENEPIPQQLSRRGSL